MAGPFNLDTAMFNFTQKAC